VLIDVCHESFISHREGKIWACIWAQPQEQSGVEKSGKENAEKKLTMKLNYATLIRSLDPHRVLPLALPFSILPSYKPPLRELVAINSGVKEGKPTSMQPTGRVKKGYNVKRVLRAQKPKAEDNLLFKAPATYPLTLSLDSDHKARGRQKKGRWADWNLGPLSAFPPTKRK